MNEPTTPNTFSLTITEEEAKVLLQLLHVAVQARGLEAAAAGAHFQQKINAAVEASKTLDKPVEK